MERRGFKSGVFALSLGAFSFLIALLDWFLKSWALQHLPSEAAAPIASPLAFVIHKNPGIAFDIPIPLPIVIVITGIIAVSLLVSARHHQKIQPFLALSSVTIAFGAIGNLLDRIMHGFTTDYIILFRTSAINLSDILILVGIAGLLLYTKGNTRQRETT